MTSGNLPAGLVVQAFVRSWDTGPVKMYLVAVDLTDPALALGTMLAEGVYLSEEAQWPREPVSQLVARSGAVLGVNANFFEMNSTMNPRGMHIHSGRLVKSHNTRWNACVGFTAENKPYFGYWHWRGGIRALDGGASVRGAAYYPTAGLNITTAGSDDIVLYQAPWRRSLGLARREQGDEDVVELVVEDQVELEAPGALALQAGAPGTARIVRGRVSDVRRNAPGVCPAPGQLIVSGCGKGAEALGAIRPGDQVELFYTIEGEPFGPEQPDWRTLKSVVAGNLVILKEGRYCDPRVLTLEHLHPRTVVATNKQGNELYLLVIDGRSEESVGVKYKQVADYLLSIGAWHALNLDGGGSSTLVVRDVEADTVRVVNVPCEGAERPVPDGLGILLRTK